MVPMGMRKVRQMCGISLREKKTSAEFTDRLGIETIGSVLKRNRWRWFGQREKRKRGLGEEMHIRLKKTWLEVVKDDLKGLDLASADAVRTEIGHSLGSEHRKVQRNLSCQVHDKLYLLSIRKRIEFKMLFWCMVGTPPSM